MGKFEILAYVKLQYIMEEILEYVPRLFEAVRHIARSEGILETGFRTLFNCNKEGAQSVYHLHLHLIGGEQLGVNMSGL